MKKSQFTFSLDAPFWQCRTRSLGTSLCRWIISDSHGSGGGFCQSLGLGVTGSCLRAPRRSFGLQKGMLGSTGSRFGYVLVAWANGRLFGVLGNRT